MINETTNELQLFLKDSPYTESEKRDITLYIDGLGETEKTKFTDLINCCLNGNKEVSQ